MIFLAKWLSDAFSFNTAGRHPTILGTIAKEHFFYQIVTWKLVKKRNTFELTMTFKPNDSYPIWDRSGTGGCVSCETPPTTDINSRWPTCSCFACTMDSIVHNPWRLTNSSSRGDGMSAVFSLIDACTCILFLKNTYTCITFNVMCSIAERLNQLIYSNACHIHMWHTCFPDQLIHPNIRTIKEISFSF